MSSYISNKVKVSQSKTSGQGLVAVEKINKDEIVVDYSQGLGKYINTLEADRLFEQGSDHMIQIGEDLFFAATEQNELEEADFVNHSCDPNAGIKNNFQIVAMRDIDPGEEITIDYAMSESSEYEIKCNCRKLSCRGVINGRDWMIPELQKKYNGYFSDYLQKRINI